MMRHSVNAGVAVIALLEPGSRIEPGGRALLATVLLWSVYRLATRSQRGRFTAVDFALTIATCLAIPVLAPNPEFQLSNSAPQAIAGTAVIGFAVSLPARTSLPMTLALAICYAVGLSDVLGWARAGAVLALYYFGLQWLASAMIRYMLLRVAAAVDRVRDAREAAGAARQVEEAVRTYEREQLALLHDTAASTLLVVGQGLDVPGARLAAQARRDLTLLRNGPWQPVAQPVELMAAVRELTSHATTPVTIDGPETLWVRGEAGQAVIDSSREAINNVDRHARAGSTRIVVTDGSLSISDDGVGFDTTRPGAGHGIAHSMAARMTRVGGSATVESKPGTGTRVVFGWPAHGEPSAEPPPIDPDRLIERVRLIYATAITVYAVANLAVTVPYGIDHARLRWAEIMMAVVLAACPLFSIPALRSARRLRVWPFVAAVLVVVVIHPTLLDPNEIGSQADWVQGAAGWSLLPLLLTIPTRRAARILVGIWVVGAIAELSLNPVVPAWVNIALGTGSILGVQLFALAFDGLMRDAAADVHAEVEAHKQLIVAGTVARAVAVEYRRRYAGLIDAVVPLLEELAASGHAHAALRRSARAESRRLRALFHQSRTFDHPVMQHLRPAVDAAEARHVDVTMEVSGVLPEIGPDDLHRLLAPLRSALSADMSSAHVVLSAVADGLSLSVVCRGVEDPDGTTSLIDDQPDVDTVVLEDVVWIVVEYRVRREP